MNIKADFPPLVEEIDYGTPESRAQKQVTLSVDGRSITVPEGTSIMRAAMEGGVETVDKIMAGDASEDNLAVVKDLCNTMKFGSLCALGGFTPYPVMSALTHFPEDFRRPTQRLQAAE